MAYTVIDIETTGLSKHYHKITEIAAARVKKGKVVRTFHTLVNPRCRIPSFITKLTGIDNDMIKDAPKISDILPAFVRFLGQDIFVAHNATFDYGFLSYNLERCYNYKLKNPRLCTRKLANRLIPGLPSKRLGSICKHFSITNDYKHRAMGDVLATVQVFNNLLNILNKKGICKAEEIFRFEKSRIIKPDY